MVHVEHISVYNSLHYVYTEYFQDGWVAWSFTLTQALFKNDRE